MNTNKNELTIFMPSLHIGGAEMVVIRLLEGMVAKGVKVDLVLATTYGELRNSIPEEVNVIDLNCSRTIYSVFKLARYLKNKKPPKLLSHLQRANRIAILGKIISRVNTEIYLVSHTTVSSANKNASFVHKLLSNISYKILYKKATKLIHVSNDAARDLEKELKMGKNSISVIYNPIVTKKMINGIHHPPPHQWLKNKSIPVVLAAGGLRPVKGYDILIDAFYDLQNRMDSRLILLGDGELRYELTKKISNYKLDDKVYMPGYVDNVHEYMAYASVFVLSSSREALPTVLVEAMSCGCTVVSTDCQYGPSEILENGKYGYLVPVNDPLKLSYTIEKAINNPLSRNKIKNRARDFTVEQSIDNYLRELNII